MAKSGIRFALLVQVQFLCIYWCGGSLSLVLSFIKVQILQKSKCWYVIFQEWINKVRFTECEKNMCWHFINFIKWTLFFNGIIFSSSRFFIEIQTGNKCETLKRSTFDRSLCDFSRLVEIDIFKSLKIPKNLGRT